MTRPLDDAIAFAEPVLGADSPTDFREVVGGRRDLIGLFQAALGGELQPIGDVVLDRAMNLAEGYAALGAAAGLRRGLALVETGIDFGEIAPTARGRAFFRHFAAGRDEGQHLGRHGLRTSATGVLKWELCSRKTGAASGFRQ